MKKSTILFHGLLHAVGVLAYIVGVVAIMSNAEKVFKDTPDFMAGIFMLTLFVVSACITSSLVLGRPIYMYLEGNKHSAVLLLGATVLWLVVLLMIVATLILVV